MKYDFVKQLHLSKGVAMPEDLAKHLLDSIPNGIEIIPATTEADRQGTDYWIRRSGTLPAISIDVKHREFDPIDHPKIKSDDALIETTSVYTGPKPMNGIWEDKYREKPGWTIDSEKHTDLVVYTWPQSDGRRRFWILYFPFLCEAARRNWRIWVAQYGERYAENSGYYTLFVCPPRVVIANAMRQLVVGKT